MAGVQREQTWNESAVVAPSPLKLPVESPDLSVREREHTTHHRVRGTSSPFFTGHEAVVKPTIARDVKAELRKIDELNLGMKTRRAKACFGELMFDRRPEPGESRLHQWPPPAKFCTLASDSEIDKVFQMLTDCWDLKRPSVLLSVTGSAQDLDLDPRIEHEFKERLAAAASHTAGWVITGGTDTGVMAIVGKALRERNLHAEELAPVIGICPWAKVMDKDDENVLNNRSRLDKLFNHDRKFSEQSVHSEPSFGFSRSRSRFSKSGSGDAITAKEEAKGVRLLEEATVHYMKERKNSNHEVALDPGHTHFLLVDDGTTNWYSEIVLRAALEQKICEFYRVPGVQIVVQGGFGTFETVAQNIARGMQVVLVRDSGGAAQLISELVEPLLERAADLPLENFKRLNEIKKRIDELKRQPHFAERAKRFIVPHGSSGKLPNDSEQYVQMWDTLARICLQLERISTFEFDRRLKRCANKKAVRRPFDQAILDAVVQAYKCDAEKSEKEEAGRRKSVSPMDPSVAQADSQWHARWHVKSRSAHPDYPKRFDVPDDKASWKDEWKEYAPVHYEAGVLSRFARPLEASPQTATPTQWADPPMDHFRHGPTCEGRFPSFAAELQNRLTYKEGATVGQMAENKTLHDAELVDESSGMPRNPRGRTGISGRGLLGKWGPNHAADPIVTCYKDGKLMFIAEKRIDTQQMAIPGAMVNAGEVIGHKLRSQFSAADAQRKAHLPDSTSNPTRPEAELEMPLFELLGVPPETKQNRRGPKGVLIFSGYVDDPRNTDNAWCESRAVHFHCTDAEESHLSQYLDKYGKTCVWLQVDPMSESRGAHAHVGTRAAAAHAAQLRSLDPRALILCAFPRHVCTCDSGQHVRVASSNPRPGRVHDDWA